MSSFEQNERNNDNDEKEEEENTICYYSIFSCQYSEIKDRD